MAGMQERAAKYLRYYPVIYLRGQMVPRHLERLKRSQFDSPSVREAKQLAALNGLLADARKEVPYYRRALAGIELPLASLQQLDSMPTLAKEQLKHHEADLASEKRYFFLTNKTTGGSTGQPVSVSKTRDAMARELAATWRAYSWLGVDIGDRQARLWGVPHEIWGRLRARAIDFVANRLRLSAFAFTDDDLRRYVEQLQRFKPSYIYGYASMLAGLAEHMLERGVEIPPVKGVISTSELLTAQYRSVIETAFRCRVFNEYGCGEVGTIAHECVSGNMHLMSENMIVETVRGDIPCAPGEEGELVVTELNNRAMPLIRYRMGDYGSLGDGGCPCGVTLPVLREVLGRAYDTVSNSSGKRFHPEFFLYAVEDAKRRGLGVGGLQFIEKGTSDFLIRVQNDGRGANRIEEYLRNFLVNEFDPKVALSFEYVDRIEREPSGKMRVVKAAPPAPSESREQDSQG